MFFGFFLHKNNFKTFFFLLYCFDFFCFFSLQIMFLNFFCEKIIVFVFGFLFFYLLLVFYSLFFLLFVFDFF